MTVYTFSKSGTLEYTSSSGMYSTTSNISNLGIPNVITIDFSPDSSWNKHYEYIVLESSENMLEFLEYAKTPYLVVDRRDVAPTNANGGGYIFNFDEFSRLTKRKLVKRTYLSVSTYTKENYTFFQDEVDFDIKAKFEELNH